MLSLELFLWKIWNIILNYYVDYSFNFPYWGCKCLPFGRWRDRILCFKAKLRIWLFLQKFCSRYHLYACCKRKLFPIPRLHGLPMISATVIRSLRIFSCRTLAANSLISTSTEMHHPKSSVTTGTATTPINNFCVSLTFPNVIRTQTRLYLYARQCVQITLSFAWVRRRHAK